jgi:hypothetical protein
MFFIRFRSSRGGGRAYRPAPPASRDSARDNDRELVGPPRAREGEQRAWIQDFPGGFWRETLTRKARDRNPARARQRRRKTNQGAAETGFCRATRRANRARRFANEPRRPGKMAGFSGFSPGLREPGRRAKPRNFVGLSVYHPRQNSRRRAPPLLPGLS